MSGKYQIPMSLALQFKAEYENGATVSVLAEKYGVALATICRNIRRVGGELRPQGKQPHRKAERGLLGWLHN